MNTTDTAYANAIGTFMVPPSHYFGGLKSYWQEAASNDRWYADGTTPALVVRKLPRCEYCGVRPKSNDRVTCEQCGAPLRGESIERDEPRVPRILTVEETLDIAFGRKREGQ